MKSHPKSASVISRVILLTGLLGVVLALVPAAPATAQDAPSKKSYDDLMREMYRLHEAKEYKDALRVAQEIHKLRPDDNRAMYNLACLHCLCGDHDEALSWLEKCVEAGFNDVKLLLEDSDLAAVRDTERYKRVVAKLRGDDKKEEPKPAATEETRAPRREGRRPAAETATDAAKKPESTPAAAPKTKLIVKSDYVVSVAEGHDASRAAPLIVALHGSRGNMRKFVDRWAAAAAAQGAVLLAFINSPSSSGLPLSMERRAMREIWAISLNISSKRIVSLNHSRLTSPTDSLVGAGIPVSPTTRVKGLPHLNVSMGWPLM